MRAIGDHIAELSVILSVIALIAFFIWGFGYLIVREMEQTDTMYKACIAADKQWVKGNCVK